MRKVGASYYDKPDESNPGGVWDQHLKSEAAKPRSNSPTADTATKMMSTDKIQSAMKQAETTGGKVDYDKVCDCLILYILLFVFSLRCL